MSSLPFKVQVGPKHLIIIFSLKWIQASPIKLNMKIKCAAPRPRAFYHIFSLKWAQAGPIKLKDSMKHAAFGPPADYHQFQLESSLGKPNQA